MTHLFSEHFQAGNSSGVPLSGALLYFYQSETTTPITVYQDFDKNASHTNPVTADAAGLFAPIFVDTLIYKVVLKTSAGTTVQTIDKIHAPQPYDADLDALATIGAAAFSGFLYGLTLSNNAGDATNDIDIAAGTAIDSTNAKFMTLSAITKRLDANWSVGTNQGGLDTGSIANTTYHVWLIKRSDTGVVDVLFSTSASAPTMPASYDYKRRIGSIVRSGGALKAFVQDGDRFMWAAPVADIAAANPGTSAVTRTLTLPTGIRVKALVAVGANATSANTDSPTGILLSDLSATDTVPDGGTGLFSVDIFVALAAQIQLGGYAEVMTNTSAQIRSRIQGSAAGTTLIIGTLGWVDTRGRI